MKKFTPIIFLFVFILFSCNRNHIPKAVTQSFENMYPESSNAIWEINDDDTYRVDFENDKCKCKAEFEASGNWIMIESEILSEFIPENIIDYIHIFYPDKTIQYKFVELTENQLYKAYLEGESESTEIIFDKFGHVIKDELNPIFDVFTRKYPNAADVHWNRQDNGNFVASFIQDETSWNSTFLSDGNWVSSTTSVTINDLPEPACMYLEKIKKFEPKEYKEKTNAEGRKYMVDGQIRQTSVSYVFDEFGNFIEKVNLKYK